MKAKSTVQKPLTKAEEEIMQVLWRLGNGFIKDIVDGMPDPAPHYNTVSTIIKILVDKKVVGYETFGKANRYYPLVQKDDYSRSTVGQLVKKYFDGSYSNMFSFFAREQNITVGELEEILKELKQQDSKK